VRRIEHIARTLETAGPSLVLHLPVSIACLRLTSTRSQFLAALRRRLSDHKKQVIIELCDIPAGFPGTALSGLVAQIAPCVRMVLARGRPTAAPRGLRAAIYEAEWGMEDAALTRDLQQFCAGAEKLDLCTAAYGLSRRSQVLIARAAGATHVSGPAVSEAFGGEMRPQRFCLGDLYREAGARPGVALV
jgi:hypothetical protein